MSLHFRPTPHTSRWCSLHGKRLDHSMQKIARIWGFKRVSKDKPKFFNIPTAVFSSFQDCGLRQGTSGKSQQRRQCLSYSVRHYILKEALVMGCVSHARSRCLMRTTLELMATSTVRLGSE